MQLVINVKPLNLSGGVRGKRVGGRLFVGLKLWELGGATKIRITLT